jgi:hypothetical protein
VPGEPLVSPEEWPEDPSLPLDEPDDSVHDWLELGSPELDHPEDSPLDSCVPDEPCGCWVVAHTGM